MKVGLSPWQGGPQGVWYEQMKTPCCKKRGEAFSKLRSPWKRGPQEVWYEQMKALCCRKRDEALSKLRFRWNRGTNTETPRHSRFRGNVGISIRFAVEIWPQL